MKIQKAIALALGIAAFAGLSGAAMASSPGQGITPIGPPPGPAIPAPQVLVVSTSTPYSITGSTTGIAGTVEESVYQNTHTGDLTFTYQFTSASTNANGDEVLQLATSSYKGFLVGTAQSPLGPLGVGSMISTSTSESPGGAIDWNFLPGGDYTSYLLIVTTNATRLKSGVVTLQDGGSTGAISGFYAPAVPEPGTVAAFVITGLGILLMVATSRRKSASLKI